MTNIHRLPFIPNRHSCDISLTEKYVSKTLKGIYKQLNIPQYSMQHLNAHFMKMLQAIDPLFIQATNQIVNYCNKSTERITSAEIKEISKEYVKLKTESLRKLGEWHEFQANVRTCKNDVAFYYLMANISYFDEAGIGTIIETGKSRPNYEVSSIIQNDKGLRALYLVPVDKDRNKLEGHHPILSFRGTLPHIIETVEDDFQVTIGINAFLASKAEIEKLLQQSKTNRNEKMILVGHSLGGAIAQIVMAEFVAKGLINSLYHYNSPGVGDFFVNRYTLHKETIEEEPHPEIQSFQHIDDLLPLLGGLHLPTENRHVIIEKNPVSAHTIHSLYYGTESEIVDYSKLYDSLKHRVQRVVLEATRSSLSPTILLGIRVSRVFLDIKEVLGDFRGSKKNIDAIYEAIDTMYSNGIDVTYMTQAACSLWESIKQKFSTVPNQITQAIIREIEKQPISAEEKLKLLAQYPIDSKGRLVKGWKEHLADRIFEHVGLGTRNLSKEEERRIKNVIAFEAKSRYLESMTGRVVDFSELWKLSTYPNIK